MWHRLFGGSPRSFVAALAETDTLTDADIDELAAYLEELKKERKQSKICRGEHCSPANVPVSAWFQGR